MRKPTVGATANSTGSTEERNMRRKRSEIGDTQISDDPEYTKREIGIASRRSEETMENLRQKFRTNTMANMQLVTKQTNETILQSVGSQLQGMNTTDEKMKVDIEDKYRRMDEKITTLEGEMTLLEDHGSKRRDTNANDMEGKNA